MGYGGGDAAMGRVTGRSGDEAADRAFGGLFAGREHQALGRAERVLGRWAGIAASISDPLAGREIARIEQAILKGNVRVLDEYGDLQGALKRIGELKKRARKGSRKTIIEGLSTWRSRRLSRRGF